MALSKDPYEQRLYHMFLTHDIDATGGLDREALLKLCLTLELKERGQLLVKCLLNEEKVRVTFKEFREGLLHILGEEEHAAGQRQKSRSTVDQTDSADDQNVSTSSPTAVSASTAFSSNNSSSSSTSAGSIISNTSKHHHHPHLTYQRQAAADRDAQQRTESESVGRAATNKISSIVPSCCEEDLITTTTTTTSPTNPITTTSDNENESSDREVSPKFIVGTKKYGRRSRPREDCNGLDTSSDLSNSDNESVSPSQQKDPNGSSKTSSKVQRSASQSDIHGSKRRRPMSGARLKRCVSLPTHRQRPDVAQSKLNAKNVREQLNMDEKIDKKIYFLKLSENLRDIWDSLVGDGHGALLNQSQLEIVCERVGLQKLPAKLAAKEVFSKLCLQPIEGISFNEFISLLQSDSDILPIGDGGMDGVTNKAVSDNACVVAARLFDESDSFKAQELDRDSVEETVGFSVQMPDWTAEIGSLSSAIIVDMWESAGVVDAKNLLQDLGFYDEEIQVTNLVTALEDELQRLGDSNETYVIVKASLALHKAEVAALRQAFVQLVEENKKLYADNKEVNQRALLIAQEVDERTNSLEASTRNKIRLLEQRHNEAIRELSSQLAHEREQLSSTSSNMEKRIRTLETEEARQKGEIWRLSGDNEILRIEQENLTKELTELLEKNIKLNKDIAELEENNRNDFDDGFDRKDDLEVLELIEKISLLQNENTDLRDKNDEFSAEIESLNVELAKFKLKRSSVNRTSSLEMSPVVVETTGGTEENASAARKRQGDSPSKARLSDESPRLGKFRKCSNDLENESDSSGDWMALQSELGIKVDSAIASSGISQDFSSNNESSCNDAEIRQLKTKIAELEKKLEERGLGSSSEKTENEIKGAPTTDSDLSEHDKMKARCDELEASLEQMSKEYEACEDYWQNKVNEERQLFEEEQRISDDKFNELLKKMAEYEEQFAGQGTSKVDDGRLSPIEEKDILEQQYLDLELELQQTQLVLEEKSHEVDKLRNRIAEFEQLTKYSSETMLATPPRVDTPEIDSPASSPISYLMKQSTIQAPTRDYQNPNWCQPLSNGGPVDTINGPNASRSPTSHSIAAVEVDEQAIDEDSGFNRTISPIHKPIIAASSATDVTSCGGDHRDMGDCSDVCSVKSARSTHSLASTHSIHKSVSQNDVTMVSQEQLKQLRLMQLQLQDEIKELTQQRDCLKMEFQQLCEAKPILARAYTKTNHPNQTQKIQHLEQKIRQQQSMLKQQQIYTENILHQIWQQQRSEISNLRDRLEAQSVVISEQANRLASNDVLVKDLYMENSNLLVQVQRLEQQKARAQLLQQFSQATANAHHQASHHQSQLSGIVPGLP